MRDPDERLRETVAALLAWIAQSSVRSIVLCDNSGIELDFSPIRRLADRDGVEFEAIIYKDNSIAQRLGKGAGEGHILDRALSESRLLANCATFWKCTGKLFVSNFTDLAASHRLDPVVFKHPGWSILKPFDRSALGLMGAAHQWTRSRLKRIAWRTVRGFDPEVNVNTQFWKSSVEFFDRTLRHCYTTVCDRRRYFIEHAYAKAMRGMDIAAFETMPRIVGRSGSIKCTYGGGMSAIQLDEADRVIDECRGGPLA